MGRHRGQGEHSYGMTVCLPCTCQSKQLRGMVYTVAIEVERCPVFSFASQLCSRCFMCLHLLC